MAAIELYSTPLFTDANLISYYRMEGNSNDAKGLHNGADTNVSYHANYGKFGQGAIVTIAAGNGINLGNTSDFNFTSSNFSFSFWFAPKDNANNKTLFSRGQYVIDGYFCSIFTSGANVDLGFYTNQDGVVQANRTSTVFELDTMHHVAIVREGSVVTIYKNAAECSYSAHEAVTNPLTSTKNFYILRYELTTYEPNAYMDDFAIFNRALTTDEVSKLYTGDWPTEGGAFLLNFI